MEENEIKHRAVRGVIALTARTIFLQLISAVALFLLQIFLEVKDLGVFFIVTAVFQIFTLFTDVGLGAALIQKKEEITEEELGTVFFLQEILVFLAIAIGVIASPVVKNYAHLGADGIFLYFVLLFTLFISSLKVIPSILLERKLAFDKQILPQIVESIFYNFIVVILAWKGLGIKSYAWAFLVSALVGLPIYYFLAPWKIKFFFAKGSARKLLSFGLFYQGKSFLAVVKDNLFTFVMAGLVGQNGIGFWGTAQRWAYFPYRFVVDSVTKVTFPAYSRAQENLTVLRVGIEKSLFVISLILLPLYAIMTVNIYNLIFLLPKYTKWEPAIISFYFLCSQAVMAALTNILVNVLDATGRVKTTLFLMTLWIIGTWGLSFLLIAKFGFTGIAVAQFLVSLTIVLVVYLVRKFITFDFFGNVFPPLAATIVAVLMMIGFVKILPLAYASVFITIMAGSIIYLIFVWLLAKEKIKMTVELIIHSFKK